MSKRLNIKLDSRSFSRLEKIKETHEDASYTTSIKRAVATLYYFEKQIEKGDEFFLVKKSKWSFLGEGDKVYQIVLP